MNKPQCNCNLEYASILEDNKLKYKINISDYIKDEALQKEIKNSNKRLRLVCDENHDVIKYVSLIKKNHFKHKTISKMTDWHKEWQNNFKQKEIRIGEKTVDVLIDDVIIEFQHSYISEEDINSRNINAKNNNKILYWVIDCNNTIEVEKKGEIYMIHFYNDFWKFEHFKCHDFIFLNLDDCIYKIKPNDVKSYMIDVIEYKTNIEFINSLKNNINIWSIEEIPQCILYHNQRGAGCGKTYESIQLMNKDEKFKHIENFIYLTKAHSAKEVIYNELKEQRSRGSLENLEIPIEGHNDSGKQYKINYHNKTTNLDCKIIIGTIDSFMYAIGNTKTNDKDYFNGIVNSIKNGYVKTSNSGSIRYAQNDIKLNKNCLIIIDEAQDLEPVYIEAMCSIMRNTYIDVYIIGDKLQSIWGENNIHSFLEKHYLPHITININKSEGKNQVMRFHNEQFKDFVNDIIDFKKYELPSIEKICNNPSCKYKHENDKKPYNIFSTPIIYSNERDNIKIDNLIQTIINYMKKEIDEYDYIPNNFMFIFPILSKNAFANRLEAKLQDFWIGKFNDINYQKNVLNNNEYWREKIKDNKYYKHVFIHKSDEGKSIDLRESDHATRILSIHSSKGNGCEVVFLFGLNQGALEIFSKEKCNLQYDSLLHVALTRQKKSLYIGIEDNGDDISRRFKKYIAINNEIRLDLTNIKKSNKYKKIIDFAYNSDTIFKDIYKKYSCSFKNILQKKENQDDKKIVDWGHHIIRMCVFEYNILYNIINNEIMSKVDSYRDQYITILAQISELEIIFNTHSKYYKNIHKINEKYIFPILIFSGTDHINQTKYNKYNDVLYDFIKNIQKKIKKGIKNKNLPSLCPLETVILLHMIKLYKTNIYSDITIMDVYSIIYYFDEVSNSTNMKHNENYKCKCKDHFIKNNDDNLDKYQEIQKSIINHHIKVEQISELYKNYKKYIIENLGDSCNFKYNIFHPVVFGKIDNNFKISNEFILIANSDKYVIDFIITPQFNELNFNKIVFKGIFNNFLLQNNCVNYNNNYIRFEGKKIYTCILSLDTVKPIFIEFKIDKKCDIINRCIKEYLQKEYSDKNKIIYNFYKYCKKNKPKNETGIAFTLCKINEENTFRLSDGSHIPNYIIKYFNDIESQLEYCPGRKDDIIKDINNQEQFLKNINGFLDYAIDKYLNEDENIDIDVDY